jgi:hypothetical protein
MLGKRRIAAAQRLVYVGEANVVADRIKAHANDELKGVLDEGVHYYFDTDANLTKGTCSLRRAILSVIE